jgi:hypothetical protein
MGASSPRNGLTTGFRIPAVAGTVTVSVTLVGPDPAGTLAGENVPVAPVGSPATVNVIALAEVPPLGGVTDMVYVACPPGLTVDDVEPPLGGPNVKSSTVSLSAALVTAAKFASPEYTAVMVCVPAASVEVE